MNTSFSKYVKQCKWGLGLDTAGSDYRAHQLARLLTTILGRLPGPSALRWEGSSAESGAGGRPASPGAERGACEGACHQALWPSELELTTKAALETKDV